MHVLGHGRRLADELGSNRSEEPRGFAAVAFAPLEEEAGAKGLFIGELVCHRAGNRRLAGASHSLEPEYAILLRVVGPLVSLAKNVDPGVGIACRLALFGRRVERNAFHSIESSHNKLLVRVECRLAGSMLILCVSWDPLRNRVS